MNEEIKEYPINTFDDFLNIPAEHIDAALAEFCEAIKMVHAMNDSARNLLSHLLDKPVPNLGTIGPMKYKADGKKAITVNITEPKL